MTLSGGEKPNPSLLGSALAVEEVFSLFLNRRVRERKEVFVQREKHE